MTILTSKILIVKHLWFYFKIQVFFVSCYTSKCTLASLTLTKCVKTTSSTQSLCPRIVFAHLITWNLRCMYSICCQGDFSVWPSESFIQTLTGDKSGLWGLELWKQKSSCLNMSPLVKGMIESLSKFSTRGALSALAEVYLSCLMCLDQSMRLLRRCSYILSYHSLIWQQML